MGPDPACRGGAANAGDSDATRPRASPAATLPPWLCSPRHSSGGREKGFGQGLIPIASGRKGIWFPEKVYTAAAGGRAGKIHN